MDILEKLKNDFKNDYEKLLTNPDNLEEIKNKYLSRKGLIPTAMSKIRDIEPEKRRDFGQGCNALKEEVTKKLGDLENKIKKEEKLKKLKEESFDINLPSDNLVLGNNHPLAIIVDMIKEYFKKEGYEINEGPEIESDYFNFEMMNIPKNHPARAMQDSFYFDENLLLRTHTSPVQARVMQERKGRPIKLICPGKVYRKDEEDATHSHQFMQVEGLVLGSGINFLSLKNTLLNFLKHLFGSKTKIRLRPSYFPFTEPSIEVDMTYEKDGKEKYIEILGAGMVHPNVLKMSGYNPKKIKGFAFGIGIERIAMLYYGINDIRYFYQNDIRFLDQFKEHIR